MKEHRGAAPMPRDENLSLNHRATGLGYRMDFHCHRGFEVFQFFSGEGTLLVEDKIYPLEPESLYIINSLYLHRTMPDENIAYVRTVLTLRPDFLTGRIGAAQMHDLFAPFHAIGKMGTCKVPVTKEEFRRIEALLAGIGREMASGGTHWELVAALQIAEILALISRACRDRRGAGERPVRHSAADENIYRILEYINANITGDITMEQMAAQLNLSRYYLCHLFKRRTGFSIFEYVFNRRIATAKKMLLETGGSITEIAESLRFSDTAHFSRSFKKSAGLSPREYRRAAGSGPVP